MLEEAGGAEEFVGEGVSAGVGTVAGAKRIRLMAVGPASGAEGVKAKSLGGVPEDCVGARGSILAMNACEAAAVEVGSIFEMSEDAS